MCVLRVYDLLIILFLSLFGIIFFLRRREGYEVIRVLRYCFIVCFYYKVILMNWLIDIYCVFGMNLWFFVYLICLRFSWGFLVKEVNIFFGLLIFFYYLFRDFILGWVNVGSFRGFWLVFCIELLVLFMWEDGVEIKLVFYIMLMF